MTGAWIQVALAVARRTIHKLYKSPALLLPSLVFPIFFFVAFAGGLSAVSNVPGFDFPSGYTAFQFVFVLLQAAAFGGVFTGFTIAMDFETGFARRMMLAAPHRSAVLGGYALSALFRAVVTGAVLFAVALIGGMQVGGDGVDLFGLIALSLLMNLTAALFAAGIALRVRSIQGGPAMQIPIFILLFLAPVYVPLDLLSGWVEAVASVNPVTALLDSGRGFISGEPVSVALAFAAIAGMLALMLLWAVRSLRRAEAAG